MTTALHLTAQPNAPIACDMSTAQDTPDERLAEYRRLFERALLRRERRADAVVFHLRADPGIREAIDDLARREAACCPFLEYRVETVGHEVIYTIANPITDERRATVEIGLDAIHALADHAGSPLPSFFDHSWRPSEIARVV
jgi:hypothetical protein